MGEPTEMEARVARALCAEFKFDADMILSVPTFAGLTNEPFWKTYLYAARAAIRAMREPTKEMIEPGNDAVAAETWLDGYESCGYSVTIEPTCARTAWQAMIDAASPDHG